MTKKVIIEARSSATARELPLKIPSIPWMIPKMERRNNIPRIKHSNAEFMFYLL
jgi:hypothetical protein